MSLRDDAAPRVFADGEIVAETYEIRAVLGAGAMGEVYEAHDRALNRSVAVKVVRPHVSQDYLLREGQALAAIHHVGVVAVYTMGRHRGVQFLVLERVRGISLDRMLTQRRGRGERYELTEALDLVAAVADALSAVHAAGLAHRDVKPANVMLAPGGRVVLMDFGLVWPHAERGGRNAVAGSLDYMAPEALSGNVAEGAAHLVDLYALGVLAFEVLTGIMPFDRSDGATRWHLRRIESVRADVPAPLRAWVHQLLSPDPEERPQSAEAAVWQLRSMRSHVAQAAPRPFSVLLVDGDADMREALALYVRTAAPDAEIESTAEGRQALRSVRRRVPDLLLVDLDLPDINGIEVCMTLRGMRLGNACVIVSIARRATAADVELLRQLGVRPLAKGPRLMEELIGLVEKMRSAAQ
jgi:serine/threonine-protein kinase